MVYKTGKYGTRSGTTFRGRKERFLQRYRRCGSIIRQHTGEHEDPDFRTKGILGEDNAMTDNVQYSLNKQRRWELPDIIEDLILEQKHDENYSFQLVQRHRLFRKANCVSVAATDGVYKYGKVTKDRLFKIKNSGGFFQSSSVLKGKPSLTKRERRERRRQRQVDDATDDVEVQPEKGQIRYEVHYPTPDTSYLAHSPKDVGNELTKPFYWTGYQDRRGKHRNKAKVSKEIKEIIEMLDDDIEEVEDETFVTEDDIYESETERINLIMTLDDIIRHANKANSLLGGKPRRHSSRSSGSNDVENSTNGTKGRVVYVDKENDMTVNTVPDNVSDTRTVVEKHKVDILPVTVILRNDETDPKALGESYGNVIIDANCFPRKFVLDISKRVVSSTICGRDNPKTTSALLVFEHDVDNEINNLKESVFKVSLNAHLSDTIKSVKIETLFDYMETNIEEITERTLFYIETLPADAVVCEAFSAEYKSVPKTTTVEQCANWSTSTYRPSNKFLLNSMFSKGMSDSGETSDNGFEFVSRFESCLLDSNTDSVVSPRDRFCSICFECLGDFRPGTALMSCSHWFCDVCWKEYLDRQINRGEIKLRCPEYDCDKLVDAGTLLSVVNIDDVLRNARHCHDNMVEVQPVNRWCPNSKCGRVIQVNTGDAKVAQCVCGEKFCMECLRKWHWPAPCTAVRAYNDKLRRTGDIGLLPEELAIAVEIHGRECPSCHKFVEKNGGCPYMHCVCGKAFCWGCGQPWGSRAHNTECYKEGSKNKHHDTKAYVFQPDRIEDKKRATWYKMAVRHRIKQHPSRVRTMKSKLKILTTHVQYFLTRAEREGKVVCLDFLEGNDSFKSKNEKTKYFLNNIFNMYTEMNLVVENTCVLLSSESLPRNIKPRIRYITNRLSTFADSIFQLFVNEYASFPPEVLVQKLKDVRFHSRKNIEGLIRIVKSLDL